MKPTRAILVVVSALFFLTGCAKAAFARPLQKEDLLGVWVLTTINEKGVEHVPIARKGFRYLGTHDDIYFTIEDGNLVFSGNGGAVIIDSGSEESDRHDRNARYFNEVNGTFERGKIYLYFSSPRVLKIKTDQDPPWPAFYFDGKGDTYSHLPTQEKRP